jgi:DNA-binding NarL/FixJ family response regulator
VTGKPFECVVLADRHHGLSEGVCGLLETMFETVVMVADETSLLESATRLQPELAVVDVSLAREGGLRWIRGLRERCPGLKLIVLSVHDEPSVRRAAADAGVDGIVLKRAIGMDLLTTIESLMAGPDDAPPAGGV